MSESSSSGTQRLSLPDICEYLKKEIDTVFMLRVLDLEEAHSVTKWHACFSEPLLPSAQINNHGFYVLLGGKFGSKAEYVPLGRPGRCDLFFPPRCSKNLFVADCVGTQVNGGRCANMSFQVASVLGCNPMQEADAV